MIGRLIRLLLWMLLGFAGVFAVLAAVNFSDQGLTPGAKALLAPQAAATPPGQNGFFLYAGITAPPGEDAYKWGQARIAVLQRAAERKDTTSAEYKNAVSTPVPSFPCRPLFAGADACLSVVRARPAMVSDWRVRHAEHLERYRRLRSLEVFEDTLDPPPSGAAASLHRATLLHVAALVELQALIAAKKVGPADVPAFLAQSPPELADPYTGKPMQWDAAERRLFFASRQLAGAGWMPERLGKGKGKVAVKVP